MRWVGVVGFALLVAVAIFVIGEAAVREAMSKRFGNAVILALLSVSLILITVGGVMWANK